MVDVLLFLSVRLSAFCLCLYKYCRFLFIVECVLQQTNVYLERKNIYCFIKTNQCGTIANLFTHAHTHRCVCMCACVCEQRISIPYYVCLCACLWSRECVCVCAVLNIAQYMEKTAQYRK